MKRKYHLLLISLVCFIPYISHACCCKKAVEEPDLVRLENRENPDDFIPQLVRFDPNIMKRTSTGAQLTTLTMEQYKAQYSYKKYSQQHLQEIDNAQQKKEEEEMRKHTMSVS